MKQFIPTLSEQNMALIVAALDCLVKQHGLQVVGQVSALADVLNASAVQVAAPESTNPEG